MASRDDFSLATKRKLAERAGFQCSFPGCGAVTVGASEDAADASVSVGEAAHICAAAPGGPRFASEMTPESRSSIENGIWMCRTHGALMDRDSTTYPAELLREWKLQAEKRSRIDVGRQRGFEPTRQAGSKLTTVRSASLACSIQKCTTEDIQNRVSLSRQLATTDSVSVILPTDNPSEWGSDSFFWRHLGDYRHELTVAILRSPKISEITTGELLSECYHRFLAGVVEPYSYGRSWVLTGLGWGAVEILAPWELLNLRTADRRRGGRRRHAASRTQKWHPDSGELEGIKVEDFGITTDSLRDGYNDWSKSTLAEAAVLERGYWVIRDPQSISTFGVATQIKDRAWFMRRAHPEAWKALLSGHPDIPRDPHPHRLLPSFVEYPEDLKGKRMIDIDPAEQRYWRYKYQIIFEDSWWWDKNDGRAFVVSDEYEKDRI